ncbi:MAG TPA: protein-L-isoaspartate(D-aspartate) O-methyltransferase [Solirubrobacterales bacterium]
MRFGSGDGDFASQRARMVEHQLRRRGIGDERVLEAMGDVPRELFVPEGYRRRSYADSALPIGESQTISQPWIVAAICQALELRGFERVLEVGTGSGYSAAVLARLAGEVTTVERVRGLAAAARELLDGMEISNVAVVVGDGSQGLPERAPFDSIAVHATAPAPPEPLVHQLVVGGRLVVPIATDSADMLTVFGRLDEEVNVSTGDGLRREVIGPCRFVPLIGTEGFPE